MRKATKGVARAEAGGSKYQVKQSLLSSAKGTLDEGIESKNKVPEKLTILQRGQPKESKDKASVRYNYLDFLSHHDNLTEQCKTLVESLSNGSQECIICSNPIYQRSAIWNCK